ncbi:hypothetical protein ADUPG1_006508, partial [Aduncisulcus paluster]
MDITGNSHKKSDVFPDIHKFRKVEPPNPSNPTKQHTKSLIDVYYDRKDQKMDRFPRTLQKDKTIEAYEKYESPSQRSHTPGSSEADVEGLAGFEQRLRERNTVTGGYSQVTLHDSPSVQVRPKQFSATYSIGTKSKFTKHTKGEKHRESSQVVMHQDPALYAELEDIRRGSGSQGYQHDDIYIKQEHRSIEKTKKRHKDRSRHSHKSQVYSIGSMNLLSMSLEQKLAITRQLEKKDRDRTPIRPSPTSIRKRPESREYPSFEKLNKFQQTPPSIYTDKDKDKASPTISMSVSIQPRTEESLFSAAMMSSDLLSDVKCSSKGEEGEKRFDVMLEKGKDLTSAGRWSSEDNTVGKYEVFIPNAHSNVLPQVSKEVSKDMYDKEEREKDDSLGSDLNDQSVERGTTTDSDGSASISDSDLSCNLYAVLQQRLKRLDTYQPSSSSSDKILGDDFLSPRRSSYSDVMIRVLTALLTSSTELELYSTIRKVCDCVSLVGASVDDKVGTTYPSTQQKGTSLPSSAVKPWKGRESTEDEVTPRTTEGGMDGARNVRSPYSTIEEEGDEESRGGELRYILHCISGGMHVESKKKRKRRRAKRLARQDFGEEEEEEENGIVGIPPRRPMVGAVGTRNPIRYRTAFDVQPTGREGRRSVKQPQSIAVNDAPTFRTDVDHQSHHGTINHDTSTIELHDEKSGIGDFDMSSFSCIPPHPGQSGTSQYTDQDVSSSMYAGIVSNTTVSMQGTSALVGQSMSLDDVSITSVSRVPPITAVLDDSTTYSKYSIQDQRSTSGSSVSQHIVSGVGNIARTPQARAPSHSHLLQPSAPGMRTGTSAQMEHEALSDDGHHPDQKDLSFRNGSSVGDQDANAQWVFIMEGMNTVKQSQHHRVRCERSSSSDIIERQEQQRRVRDHHDISHSSKEEEEEEEEEEEGMDEEIYANDE